MECQKWLREALTRSAEGYSYVFNIDHIHSATPNALQELYPHSDPCLVSEPFRAS